MLYSNPRNNLFKGRALVLMISVLLSKLLSLVCLYWMVYDSRESSLIPGSPGNSTSKNCGPFSMSSGGKAIGPTVDVKGEKEMNNIIYRNIYRENFLKDKIISWERKRVCRAPRTSL